MKIAGRVGFGIFALLALFVAGLGAAIAWWICAAVCPTQTETGGGPGMLFSALIGAASGLGAWIVSSFVGKPIAEIEKLRVQAMRTAEQYTYIAPARSDLDRDRVLAARTAIGDVATALRAHARAHVQPVQSYCRWRGYDLELAFLAMNGLRSMAGSSHYGDSTRKNNLNLLHLALNARGHLTQDEIAELRHLVAECHRQLDETSVEDRRSQD